MSGTEIALISTFGSIGYLLIGWVTMVVGVALDDQPRVALMWLWAIPVWPLLAVFGLAWLLVIGATKLGPVTLKAIQKLNPNVTEWEKF